MTEIKFYKPVGGILSAELFFASDLHSVDDMVKGQGIDVELCDDRSTYEEHFSAESGLVSVKHTLTLVADSKNGKQWMEQEFIRRCSTEGVVASVEMATGEEIIVGHCPRFLFEQALRLESLKFLSGEKLNDSPQIVLTLTCHDTLSAM